MTDDILARYQQAQSFVDGVFSNKLVLNDGVYPHWIDGT